MENTTIYEIKEACRCAVYCAKGSFYPDKDYGSKIREAVNEKQLLSYARQAIENISGVYLKNATLSDNIVTLDLLINDEERTVTVQL